MIISAKLTRFCNNFFLWCMMLSFFVAKQTFGFCTSIRPKLTFRNHGCNRYSKSSLGAGKTLVIVESPAKAKTIQNFLTEMTTLKVGNMEVEEYIVDSCMGHINNLATGLKEMPKNFKNQLVHPKFSVRIADLGVDVHNNFRPFYTTVPGKDEILKRLISTAKSVDRILLATDEDREGEAISWFLVQALKPTVPYQRAVFHEITKTAIEQSFRNPRDIDMDLVRAQETRRILDKIAGFTLSPVLWRYISSKSSAGRVQSCGLNLIAQNELERWKFVKSKYFSLEIAMKIPLVSSPPFTAKVYQINGSKIADENDFDGASGEVKSPKITVLDEEKAANAVKWLSSGSHHVSYFVSDKSERKISRSPPLPFITSSLQQEASQKLGFSPTKTMSVAQKLYENGFITYMRTDSPVLSHQALEVAKEMVIHQFGMDYLGQDISGAGKKSKTPKNAQEAHEAIRPATENGLFRSSKEIMESKLLENDEKKLYDLIYKRTLASVMKSSQSVTTTVSIAAKPNVGVGVQHHWSANLKSSETYVDFAGYTIIYQTGHNTPKKSNLLFDKIHIGDKLEIVRDGVSSLLRNNDATDESEWTPVDEKVGSLSCATEDMVAGIRCIGHETRPPSRYTEASFVKELESRGVGRPSTYAKVLQVLKERGYIIVDRQSVIPTVNGMLVAQFLSKEFPDFIDSEFTAKMEQSLDLIANGDLDKDSFLHDFYFGAQDDSKTCDANKSLTTFNKTKGLLTAIVEKIESGSINQHSSRILAPPFLEGIGVLSMSKAGIFFQPVNSDTSDNNEKQKAKAWKLPFSMESDIRTLTRESIQSLMKTEVSVEGKVIGSYISTGVEGDSIIQITMKSGRYGKYLQLSPLSNLSSSVTYVPIPQWVDENLSLSQAVDFVMLPKLIGIHSQYGKPLNLSLVSGVLSICVEGHPYRAEVPAGIYVSEIGQEMAEELLSGSTLASIGEKRQLGLWEDNLVTIQSGRFGNYLKAGSIICGFGKNHNAETITLEEAIELLKRKKIRPKKVSPSKSKSKKTATTKEIATENENSMKDKKKDKTFEHEEKKTKRTKTSSKGKTAKTAKNGEVQ